jgi:hypothetical protein
MSVDATEPTDAELAAYLEEGLPAEAMIRIEERLRTDEGFRRRFTQLLSQREGGGHSVGDLWRGSRLSCPSRQELGSYIHFHLETVGCRVCRANLDDLRSSGSDSPATQTRRRKFFESSVGRIRPVQ